MKSTTSKRRKRRATVAEDASSEKDENVFAMARGHLVSIRGSENAEAESFYFASDSPVSQLASEYDADDDQVQLNNARIQRSNRSRESAPLRQEPINKFIIFENKRPAIPWKLLTDTDPPCGAAYCAN